MKRLVLAAVAAVVLTYAPTAEASTIVGGLAFGGSAVPSGGTDWATATGINFGSPTFITSTSPGGTFAAEGVPVPTTVTFTDFVFSPAMSPNPVSPLWSFTYNGKTFEFILTQITGISQGYLGGSFLLLSGTGIMRITGYTDTFGTFDFSGQDTLGNFSFSASTAAPVPEPGTLILFGSGLLGLAAIARRRMLKS